MRWISIRTLILGVSFLLAGLIWGGISYTIPLESLRLIKFSQYSALTSAGYLYLSLLISPIYHLFPMAPWKRHWTHARRAIGVSGWGFALLHAGIAFVGQLGGFAGLAFLTTRYASALIIGLVSLLILSWMALTSTDWSLRVLGFARWKMLHRFVYLATLLTVLHTLMLGTHFLALSQQIPSLFLFCLLFLLCIELVRLVSWLTQKQIQRLSLSIGVFTLSLCVALYGTQILGARKNFLSVHPAHEPDMPASSTPHGNPRATLAITSQASVRAQKPVTLSLTVKDFTTGEPLTQLIPNHEKLMHLVAVDDELQWFSHTHPTQADSTTFSDTLTFPHPGVFYLFATVQEFGRTEITAAGTVVVGGENMEKSTPQGKKERVVISLLSDPVLSLGDFITGTKKLIFQVADRQTGKPVAHLDPYLGTLGHLVMLRFGTLDYIHIHPTINATYYEAIPEGDRTISFSLPIGHSALRSGDYKLFAEFMVDGTVYTQSFLVTLK